MSIPDARAIRNDHLMKTSLLPLAPRELLASWFNGARVRKIYAPSYNPPMPSQTASVVVSIIMGSSSDWETMKHAAAMLQQLGLGFEKRIVSAHRTPDLLFEYASTAEA